MNKVVAEVTVYDAVSGKAEILDMAYKDGKLTSLKVRWIVVSLVYDGAYLPVEMLNNMFYGEDVIKAEDLYEIKNFEVMSQSLIDELRVIDYKFELAKTQRCTAA